jgi:hypothetical protein
MPYNAERGRRLKQPRAILADMLDVRMRLNTPVHGEQFRNVARVYG